ncbi:MAG: TIGR02996 domain-containing protein [Hyphomicrobiaceae bacterium]|nr:MAG: TIGR02996 domain-containing protein [Hyphomicrobiaceae bacterium]
MATPTKGAAIVTATDTEAALLAAIRENPREDAPRLVYADALADAGRELDAIMQRIIAEPGRDEWRLDYAAELERTAGAVQRCSGTHRHDGEKFPLISGGFAWDAHGVIHRSNPKQPHHHCDEKCRVSDGRAELAEFIRVQVELAPIADWRRATVDNRLCDSVAEYGEKYAERANELRARECELWGYLPTRNGVRSYFESTLPGAAFCPESDGGKHLGSGFPIVLIQRGLPAAVVRCTLAEWMVGEECQRCRGDGKIWAAWSVKHESAIYPGRKRVDCPTCRGTGRTPGIGPRLAQRWPIERVEVADKLPLEIARGVWRWGKRVSLANGPYGLDDPIFSLARGDYPTEAAARAALSDAMIAWARGQAV